MATVIPFPADRMDDPADTLFLALMRGLDEMRGEVIALRRRAQRDNDAAEAAQEAQAVLF